MFSALSFIGELHRGGEFLCLAFTRDHQAYLLAFINAEADTETSIDSKILAEITTRFIKACATDI